MLLWLLCASWAIAEAGPEWRRLMGAAQQHFARREYAPGLEVTKQVLAEAMDGATPAQVAFTHEVLGKFQYESGAFPDAQASFERALGIRQEEEQAHPDPLALAKALSYLGHTCCKMGQFVPAEEYFDSALSLREVELGPNHPEVVRILDALISLHQVQRRFDRAEPLLRRLLAITEATYGPDALAVAGVLHLLGENLRDGENPVQAEDAFRRELAILTKVQGPDHLDVAKVLDDLGECHLAQLRPAEAEARFQRALHIQQRALGRDHPRVIRSIKKLLRLYQATHAKGKAFPLKQQLAAIQARLQAKRRRLPTILEEPAETEDDPF